MKKILLSFVAMFVTILVCNAQANRNFQFSIGPEVGITTGDFSETHSFGIGASVLAEYKFDPSASATIASGFLAYSGKKISGTDVKYQALTIIPIRGGVRYYLGPAFYSAAELGLGIISGYGESTTAFGYSLGLGTKLNTGSKNLDLGIKYDAFSRSGGTLGSVVFKVAIIL